ncbi:HAD family hydrolase [Deinococcus sp. PESE-13]
MTAAPPLQAVLFDRDDTLALTDPAVYREAALWMQERFGLDPRQAGHTLAQVWEERMNDWWDLRSHEDEEQFWEEYGSDLTARLGLGPEAAAEVMAAYPYERYMKPVAGAREVLSELRRRGLKTGVLSNTLPSIDRTLDALGLADLIDVPLATCLLGVHKPEAQAFTLAAEALGCRPEEVLFIDDRPENVSAAQAVGMRAALIDHSGQTPGALSDLTQVLELC